MSPALLTSPSLGPSTFAPHAPPPATTSPVPSRQASLPEHIEMDRAVSVLERTFEKLLQHSRVAQRKIYKPWERSFLIGKDSEWDGTPRHPPERHKVIMALEVMGITRNEASQLGDNFYFDASKLPEYLEKRFAFDTKTEELIIHSGHDLQGARIQPPRGFESVLT